MEKPWLNERRAADISCQTVKHAAAKRLQSKKTKKQTNFSSDGSGNCLFFPLFLLKKKKEERERAGVAPQRRRTNFDPTRPTCNTMTQNCAEPRGDPGPGWGSSPRSLSSWCNHSFKNKQHSSLLSCLSAGAAGGGAGQRASLRRQGAEEGRPLPG